MFLRNGASFQTSRPVALLHHAVSLEKGDIVGRAFHTRHDAELVVELDAGRAHLVTDPRTRNPGAEVVADLVPTDARQLATKKRGHLVGLDAVDRRTNDGVVQGLEGAHSRFPGHALTPTGVMAIRCKQFHLPDL